MIKLESLVIENFRGIKRLTLNFRQKNFSVCGPNGTGKSGIVDAIEFGLTGNITRLTGRGSRELSVKAHGPHVDLRNEPLKATVRISAYSPALNKSFVIERQVGKAKPHLEPQTAEIETLVKELAQHPELALSRREIVKYVIAEPGRRSEEVQALLKLEDVGKLRKTLTTLTNNFKREVTAADTALSGARAQLLSGLEIVEAKSAQIVESVNKRRALLSAEPIALLDKETNIKAGIDSAAREPGHSRISKVAATSDISAFIDLARSSQSPTVLDAVTKVRELLTCLEAEPTLLRDLQRHALLEKGLGLVDSNECPLCGVEWELEELKIRIEARLRQARIASELKAELEKATAPLRSLVRSLVSLIDLCLSHAGILFAGRELAALQSWKEFLVSLEGVLTRNRLQELQAWLEDSRREFPIAAEREVEALAEAVRALPDLAEKDAAWEFLVVGQERLDTYMKAKRDLATAKERLETASRISATYTTVSDEVLTSLYEDVEADFSRYYALIHSQDEGTFFAKLTPSEAKLSLAVDFYGRGTFPPAAYHSEGHQDSMGLCLYLALMKRTMGPDFVLAILDDVLMSVDAGHRKDVVRLLKAEFPRTQFILTTHDPVWLTHMTSEGLVSKQSSLQIRKWTVDDGPVIMGSNDVWVDIEQALNGNDVLTASALLRNYLENITAKLADRLRTQIEFRGDGVYDFGDLIGVVVGRWKELLRQAKAAANSWNKRSEVDCLAEMESRFAALYGRTGVDNWMVNKSLHYNEWANLQSQEFAPLVAAYKDLLACFECPSCKTLLFVTPKKGRPEALRCDCNMFNLTANSKSRDKGQHATPSKKAELPVEQRDLF